MTLVQTALTVSCVLQSVIAFLGFLLAAGFTGASERSCKVGAVFAVTFGLSAATCIFALISGTAP